MPRFATNLHPESIPSIGKVRRVPALFKGAMEATSVEFETDFLRPDMFALYIPALLFERSEELGIKALPLATTLTTKTIRRFSLEKGQGFTLGVVNRDNKLHPVNLVVAEVVDGFKRESDGVTFRPKGIFVLAGSELRSTFLFSEENLQARFPEKCEELVDWVGQKIVS